MATGTPIDVRLADLPLVVDLDGTLMQTDTLHEVTWRLVVASPLALAGFPSWLASGKAAFKQEVSNRVTLDATLLPYHAELVERLRTERGRRRLVLCTGANAHIAGAVSEHLALFDEVIASDERTNMTGLTKAQRLVDRFGEQGFDYVGNSLSDVPVFARARQAWVVAPTAGLQRRLPSIGNVAAQWPRQHSMAAGLVRAMRPHQWIKNILVFVPLLAAVGIDRSDALVASLLAFVSFSLVASGVYYLNDLLDIDADRRHPRKSRRPIAAGAVPIGAALPVAGILLVAGLTLAATVSTPLVGVVSLYLFATAAYTLRLKRVPVLDAIVLATLYTLRIIGGAAAIDVVPSFWLLAFSVFFFFSLALGKRFTELLELELDGKVRPIPGREYRPEDLQTLLSQGTASGYAAVVVLALYIHNGLEPGQYRYPEFLWPLCPLLLYWIAKFWLNAQRREINDDPVIWAVTNRVSRGLAVIAVLFIAAARWLPRPLLD